MNARSLSSFHSFRIAKFHTLCIFQHQFFSLAPTQLSQLGGKKFFFTQEFGTFIDLGLGK